jgi:AcrR family transcriptional regulator
MGKMEKTGAKAERTQRQILAAAEKRFAELGYYDTRLEDIGEDVGVGRSAILYHFKDKDQLYYAVLKNIFGELMAQLRSALMASRPLPDRVEEAVTVFVDYMGQRPTAARIAMRESANPNPIIRDEIRNLATPFLTLMTMIFDEGERSGVLHPTRSDPLHFVSTAGGATLFYIAALPTLLADPPYDLLSPEQLAAHRRDVLSVTRRLLGIKEASEIPPS